MEYSSSITIICILFRKVRFNSFLKFLRISFGSPNKMQHLFYFFHREHEVESRYIVKRAQGLQYKECPCWDPLSAISDNSWYCKSTKDCFWAAGKRAQVDATLYRLAQVG